MPYIKRGQRELINETLKAGDVDLTILGSLAFTSGELNYIITEICLGFLSELPHITYKDCADVISTLECAKLEFYRRAVAPYEDEAILRNSDVYPATERKENKAVH